MITFRRRILLGALKLFDVALMMFSFAVASLPVLYQGGSVSFAHFLSLRIKVGNFVLFAVLLLVWHVIFVSFGLYHSKPKETKMTCQDRKSTRLNSSHSSISYAVFCLKKKKKKNIQ